jgi:hypothetical protein
MKQIGEATLKETITLLEKAGITLQEEKPCEENADGQMFLEF